MTGARQAPTEVDQARLRDAVNDLEQLRELLLRVSRGQTDAGQLRAALEGYWRTHNAQLTYVARAVAEQVRLNLLEALYRWRAQLQQQPPRDPNH